MGMVLCICNWRMWEAKSRLNILSQPMLSSHFEVSLCNFVKPCLKKINVAEAGFQLTIVVDDDDLEFWDYQRTYHACLLFPTTSETPTFYQDCQIWMHLDKKKVRANNRLWLLSK